MIEVLFPLPNSLHVAECMDDISLVEQCHEGLIVLRVLTGFYRDKGWHEPQVEKSMLDAWRDHEFILIHHLTTLIAEAAHRGKIVYKFAELDKILRKYPKIIEKAAKRQIEVGASVVPYPDWVHDQSVQNRHRRILSDRDPEWYSKFKWDVLADPQES